MKLKKIKSLAIVAALSLSFTAVFGMEKEKGFTWSNQEVEPGDINDLNQMFSYPIPFLVNDQWNALSKKVNQTFTDLENSGAHMSYLEILKLKEDLEKDLFVNLIGGNASIAKPEQSNIILNWMAKYAAFAQREKWGEGDLRKEEGITNIGNTFVGYVNNDKAHIKHLQNLIESKNSKQEQDFNSKLIAIFNFLDDINFQQFNTEDHKLYSKKWFSYLSVIDGNLKFLSEQEHIYQRKVSSLLRTLFHHNELNKFKNDPIANCLLIDERIDTFLQHLQPLRKLGKYVSNKFSKFEMERITRVFPDTSKGLFYEKPLNDIISIAFRAAGSYLKEEYFVPKKFGYYNLNPKRLKQTTIEDLYIREKGVFISTPSIESLNGFNAPRSIDKVPNNFKIHVFDDFTNKQKSYPNLGSYSHGDEVINNLKLYFPHVKEDIFIEKYDTRDGIEAKLRNIYNNIAREKNNTHFLNISLGFSNYNNNKNGIYKLLDEILELSNVIMTLALDNVPKKEVNNSTYFCPDNETQFLLYEHGKNKDLQGRLYLVGNIDSDLTVGALKGENNQDTVLIEELVKSQSWDTPKDSFLKMLNDLTVFAVGQSENAVWFNGTSGAAPKVLATLLQGAALLKKDDEINKALYENVKKSFRNYSWQFTVGKDGKITSTKRPNNLNQNFGLGILDFSSLLKNVKDGSALNSIGIQEWEKFYTNYSQLPEILTLSNQSQSLTNAFLKASLHGAIDPQALSKEIKEIYDNLKNDEDIEEDTLRKSINACDPNDQKDLALRKVLEERLQEQQLIFHVFLPKEEAKELFKKYPIIKTINPAKAIDAQLLQLVWGNKENEEILKMGFSAEIIYKVLQGETPEGCVGCTISCLQQTINACGLEPEQIALKQKLQEKMQELGKLWRY